MPARRGRTPVTRSTTVRDRARARFTRSQAACHICGQPINYSLPYLDPQSFVVDDVVPLARGGQDTDANKAAAHRTCNRAKSDRLIAPIVRRSSSLD